MPPSSPAVAEDLLRALLDQASDLMLCVADDGRVLFANRACRDALGIEAPVAASQLRDMATSESALSMQQQVQRTLAGQPVGRVELILRHQMGSMLQVEGEWSRADAPQGPVAIGAFRRIGQASRVEVYLQSLLALRERTGDELKAFFAAATEAMAKAIGVERASIWLFDDARAHIVCQDIYLLGPARHESGVLLRAQDYPSYFRAAMHDSAIIAEDAHTHPATREFSAGYLTPLDIHSMLDVPIRSGDQLHGVICLEHTRERRNWGSGEVKFAIAVANHLMVAIEQAERRQIGRAHV